MLHLSIYNKIHVLVAYFIHNVVCAMHDKVVYVYFILDWSLCYSLMLPLLCVYAGLVCRAVSRLDAGGTRRCFTTAAAAASHHPKITTHYSVVPRDSDPRWTGRYSRGYNPIASSTAVHLYVCMCIWCTCMYIYIYLY